MNRGLITDEQLASALADQESTGQPLGKIVVERGFVRPDVVAQALATQHGGLLKTEYGFATGFGTADVAAEPLAEPPVSAPGSLRRELAHASEEAERLREDNERLAQVRAELEQRLAQQRREPDVSQLEAEIAARDAAIADFKETADSWVKALAERDDAIRGLVSDLEARSQTIAELESRLAEPAERTEDSDGLDALRAELEERGRALADAERAREDALGQVAELEAARDDALAQLRAAKASLAESDVAIEGRDAAIADLVARATTDGLPRWADAASHYVFFQGAEGYELVERSGPPPTEGDAVGVPGGDRQISRIGAWPGSPVPCVYLS